MYGSVEDVRIKSVVPVTSSEWVPLIEKSRKKIVRSTTKVKCVALKMGLESVESEYDSEISDAFCLMEIASAEKEGYDAVMIDCAADTGLFGAREKLSIPVVAPMEVSMHVASMLGDKFSILTPVRSLEAVYRKLARLYGLESKLASVRSIEVPVLETKKDKERLRRLMLDQAKKALENDNATVIVLGCTILFDLSSWLQQSLNVPVIDPGNVAVKFAEMLVDLNLAQSKIAFPTPIKKNIMI